MAATNCRLAAEADGPVAVVPPGAEAEALVSSLRPAGGEADGGPGAGPAAAREVVVLDAAALPRAFSEASGARLWLDRNLLVQGGRLPPGREAVVYTGVGAIRAGPEAPPLETHARIAGGILAEVLLATGRDLTRAGFLRAFGAAHLSDFGLDYSANALTGGAPIRFDALGSRR